MQEQMLQPTMLPWLHASQREPHQEQVVEVQQVQQVQVPELQVRVQVRGQVPEHLSLSLQSQGL